MTDGLRTSRHRMLALDLGAESGRVVVGRYDGDRLCVDEIHRFANRPVNVQGRLIWDLPRLYADTLAGIRRATAGGAFVSCGSWSLIGIETDAPVVGAATLAAGLTNELGLGNRILLRRSVTGMWLLQACRQSLARAGVDLDHEALVRLAAASPGRTAFVDPDDRRFVRSVGLPDAVRAACAETGQASPATVGTLVRVLLESLALAHASAVRELEQVTQRRISRIHIVGGGSRIEVLCQATADASGLPVDAGPAEASAIGNLLSQAMAADRISSLQDGRELVRRSFRVRTFEPSGDWSEARERFAAVMPRPWTRQLSIDVVR
ncbi:MAG TPA: FGGY-family carbohydrate kinase [Candidatus Limnocylindrales bacterium]|nr:FGGY-family carbohydrate kinase [Candidatus Limnocylindrales bacterium]